MNIEDAIKMHALKSASESGKADQNSVIAGVAKDFPDVKSDAIEDKVMMTTPLPGDAQHRRMICKETLKALQLEFPCVNAEFGGDYFKANLTDLMLLVSSVVSKYSLA